MDLRLVKILRALIITALIGTCSHVLHAVTYPSLRAAAGAEGIQIGTFADYGSFPGNPTYVATANREFSAITPGYSMKWQFTEPQRGVFDFSMSDSVVAQAVANGQQVKGHTLVWHVALPNWVSQPSSTFYADMINHITTEVTHFKGKIVAWDVLNEAFNDDGSWRNTIFLQKIGTGYMDAAFAAAHNADPNALLYYNDYGIEGINAKSNAIYNIICGTNGMRARGIPIHGIGLQTHIKGPASYTMYSNIMRFRNCGLQVDVSEMTVDITDQNLQRSIYWDIIRSCVYAGCRAVIMGSMYDGDQGANTSTLFDRNFGAKWDYWGALDALSGWYYRTRLNGVQQGDYSISFLTFSTTAYMAEYDTSFGSFQLWTDRHKTDAMIPVYLCSVGSVRDDFLSTAANCEGQTIVGMYGYGYASPAAGLVGIQRCINNHGNHFHSRAANCEGYTNEGTLFYTP